MYHRAWADSQAECAICKRNVKVVALSVDDVESHKGWINDINETQDTKVNFSIIADEDRKVAELYDPKSLEKATVRSVFVIGPDKKIKLTITYPASTGRNFEEILRVIDSLQLTSDYQVATPVNWRIGEETVILPSIPDDEAYQKFPKGFRTVKPYLRLTPQPNI